MKKLLSKDYTACFLETFSMLNSDWEAHYHNFVQEYHAANPEIIEGLKKAITAAKGVWIGIVNNISLHQIGWEIDDEGNEIRHNPKDYQLPTLSFVQHIRFIGRPYYSHIGLWFFDEQLTIIDILDKSLKLWNKGLEYERSLPEEVRQSVQHLAMPTFLDIDALITRNNRLQEVYTNYKYKSLFGIDKQSQLYINSIRNLVDGEYKYPELSTFAERWEYFVKYDAQLYFEVLQVNHFSSRAELRLSKFEKLLAKINTFIGEAEEYDVNNAFMPFDGSNKHCLYLWLTKEEYRGDRVLQSHLSVGVYAEYVLFKQWLEEQLEYLKYSPSKGLIVNQTSQIDKEQLKDFEHELSVVDFGYKKVIVENAGFKDALFKEFQRLEPKPKLHLYINAFISDEEWAKECTSNRPPAITSKGLVAANFYPMSDLEKKARELMQEFNQMCLKNEVATEYYGRFIKDTNTVKLLDEINDTIATLKKYVLSDTNVDYSGYAKATCSNIISLTNKIDVPELKHTLLTSIVDDSENMEILIKYLHEHNAENKRRQALDNYHILKNYADSIFREEISKQDYVSANEQLKSSSSSPSNPPTFGNPKLNPKVVENVFDVLKPYFAEEQHQALHTLLKTGNTSNRPLVFIGYGNQLAYAFKELFEAKLITQCTNKQLREWVILNFEYQENLKKVKTFKIDYLNKVMGKEKKDKPNFHAPKPPITILEGLNV